MRRASQRVQHLYGIVVAIMAMISTAAVRHLPRTAREAANLVIWFMGCALVLLLGMVWYHLRKRATERLTAVASGKSGGRVKVVEVTRVLFYVVPVGWEADVELDSGEHLSFGFWNEDDARRLVSVLAE